MLKETLIYDVGEEVIYQNAAHIEKGVIEKISKSPKTHAIQYHITFKDNRIVVPDIIRSPTQETDIAAIPIHSKDFLEQSILLTEEELRHIQNPLPLTSLEKEWIQLHDKYGHMSFRKMDQLVQNNMLPNKFKMF